MGTTLIILALFLAVKCITIGSGFNFIKWLKRGNDYCKEYFDWYNKQP